MERLAVLYFRVSTKRQKISGLGIKTQHNDVDCLLLSYPATVLREFCETESGSKNNRPILRDAIRFCKRVGAVLIIAKIDRLARHALFVADLINQGITIIAADKPNASHLELLEDAIRAEKEGILIRKRIKETLAAAKENGVKLGVAGKELALKNKQAAYEFAEKMAPLIRELLGARIKTVRAIMNELNRRKIPTFRKGRRKWHLTTVYHLLQRLREKIPEIFPRPCIRNSFNNINPKS
ncbi:recombinase family protein [Chitinophaga barathri]|nr:recombinase family protein [Chitinophaga barathri]